MVVRWVFTDPSDSSTWTFEVNPSDENFPGYEKRFVYQHTTAPDGIVLTFEGAAQVRKGSFSGVLTTESEFNTFYSWWDKRNQIQITDDLGRTQTVIIESFKPKRKRSHHHPWMHTYEISYSVVG